VPDRKRDIFSKGHEQCQTARGGDFGATKGSEFEVLKVLTYHEHTSWSFTCVVKSPSFLVIASILPAFGGNRGFFFYLIQQLSLVIRIFGVQRALDFSSVPVDNYLRTPRTQTVRAAVYYSNDDIRIQEVPIPRPGPGELLVRVVASGICGSDVMEWYRKHKAPLVLGHEIAGEVVEVGEGVEKFREGDRVVAAHHVPCNTCPYCLAGHHTACETLRRTNFDPGGFSEFLRLPPINVDRGTFRIPEELSYEEASFHEPLGCVLRALRNAGLSPGQNILVLGSGISGLLVVHVARGLGAGRILAVDPVAFRREMALRFGAEEAVGPEEDIPSRFQRLTRGRLADLVLVCTGAAEAHRLALGAVERGGTVVFFAFPPPEVRLSFSVTEFFGRNDRRLVTSYGAAPFDSFTALELMRSPQVQVREMITHRLPLEETARGFRLVKEARDSMKVIIKPQE